jgi:hypothetical protein
MKLKKCVLCKKLKFTTNVIAPVTNKGGKLVDMNVDICIKCLNLAQKNHVSFNKKL